MNEDGLLNICDALGLRSSHAYSGSDKWGPHLSISCPLALINHNDENDYNLSCSVSVSDTDPSLARCFSFNCGYKGSFYNMLKQAVEARGSPQLLIDLLKEIEPTEKFTLESKLARQRKVHFKRTELASAKTPVAVVNDQDVVPEARLQRYLTGIPRYALDRGLTKETCKSWELGYDKRLQRLVFPVRRIDGKLIGLTGRILPKAEKAAKALGQHVTKYHNYVGLDKAKYLFGEHRLIDKSPIIICEGQIDALITWQHLNIPCVAVMGEGFSEAHVKTLSKFSPPYIYIFTDSDPPGMFAAEKIAYALYGRIRCKLMRPPDGMDPGALILDEAKAAFDKAIDIGKKIKWN